MKMAFFFLVVVMISSSRASANPDPNFYIYLCFGQSNMEGSWTIEDQYLLVDSRFKLLADFDVPDRGWKKGQWYTAVPPLTRRTKGISLLDYFGRTMVADLPKNVRVGVVKVGVYGTKIELWDKDSYRENLATADDWKVKIADEYDGHPYAYLVELAKIAQQCGVIKGILLHQGESNAEDKDWPNKVKKIYDNLMKDLCLKLGKVLRKATDNYYEVLDLDTAKPYANFLNTPEKSPAVAISQYGRGQALYLATAAQPSIIGPLVRALYQTRY